jgi:NAD(P)-dependent dehydrogenase (short-subunit alcohol dehydrogenase family)
LADVNKTVGGATCNALQKEFGKNTVIFIPTDVTDTTQLRHMFQAMQDRFGAIDILCNNAGILDEKNWKKMIAVNMVNHALYGLLFRACGCLVFQVAMMESTHLAVEFMSHARGGRGGMVINVASMGGILPMSYAPNYCASKHGIVGFTRSMTECLTQDGVRVNCVCPEFTDTNMVTELPDVAPHTQQLVNSVGLLHPEQVAQAILKLATENDRVGAVMTVTLRRGIDFFHLPGDPHQHMKSKL